MKKISNSQPVAVSTTFKPLSLSMHIVALGGMPTSQFYMQTQGAWKPNHAETDESKWYNSDGGQADGPLRLQAQYSVADPDGVVDAETVIPTVKWYVDGTEVTSTDNTADYYKSGNLLYVRKNFTQTTPATVRCEATFTDPRTGNVAIKEDSVTLTATVFADEQWAITILSDRTRHHFPLTATSTQYTFEAEARLGSKDKTSEVAWFWDYSTDNGSTWQDIDDTCYWYVSGKNTATLTVDADFTDDITIRARIAKTPTATAPDLPNQATASLAWRWPKVTPMAFSYGGDKVLPDGTGMKFGLIVHVARRDDMTQAEQRQWIMCNWAVRKQVDSANTEIALTSLSESGIEVDVPQAKLYNTKGTKYIVDPQCAMRGVYDVLADDKGNLLADASGNLMFART